MSVTTRLTGEAGKPLRIRASRIARTRARDPRSRACSAAVALAVPAGFGVLEDGAGRGSHLASHGWPWAVVALLLIASTTWVFALVILAVRIHHVRRIARRCRLENLATAWIGAPSQPTNTPPQSAQGRLKAMRSARVARRVGRACRRALFLMVTADVPQGLSGCGVVVRAIGARLGRPRVVPLSRIWRRLLRFRSGEGRPWLDHLNHR